jgi:hypothetical protein
VSALRCHGCGAPLMRKSSHGRAPKWCSQRCRKQTLYTGTCETCGDRTGWNGTITPSRECAPCASRRAGAARKRWTRDVLVAKLREWEATYGEPPGQVDWNPHHARHILHDEARAARFEAGEWPSKEAVVREFGSWNAGMAAAGFTPRVGRGGPENAQRLRVVRERAA